MADDGATHKADVTPWPGNLPVKNKHNNQYMKTYRSTADIQKWIMLHGTST